jgi:Ras-related GTP-binding protein C/D
MIRIVIYLSIIINHYPYIIQRVVFQKMSPHETLFRLEATQGLERAVVDHTPLCRFTIWDFPGDYYGDDENVFGGSTSLIFVVDAQDEPYDHVLQSFTNAVTRALEINPNIAIEVFINKVDGELFLSDESKYDCRRDIMTQVTDELTDAGVSPDSIHIRYHLTSIYDHSIYEALSRVVQRLIPQLPTLENLLNVLVSTCSMEKAYLFDVVSKLYISTDPGPVDMQSVELCSDMIDVVLDVSGIYGLGPSHLELGDHQQQQHQNNNELPSSQDHEHVVKGESTESTTDDELVGTLISQAPAEDSEEEMIDPDSAYDSESASVIRLSNGMVGPTVLGEHQSMSSVSFHSYSHKLVSLCFGLFCFVCAGSVSKGSRYHAGISMYNEVGEFSKKELDQLQYWLPEEGIEGSCPGYPGTRPLRNVSVSLFALRVNVV